MALTPKQHIFVQGILSGLNQSDAYRKAYDVDGMLPATIHNEAFKLMNSHEISTSIEAARESQQGWTLARVVAEGERNLAGAQQDRSWPAANGALQLLSRIVGVDKPAPAGIVSITRVTVVLDSGPSLSLDTNLTASLAEPSVNDFTSLATATGGKTGVGPSSEPPEA